MDLILTMALLEQNSVMANSRDGGRITNYVIASSIMAASAGLMFGYNIGISGGVASMDSFLLFFFPAVYEREQHATESNYCKFNDQLLQTFTSSMYLAGLLATLAAAPSTQRLGRKPTMLIAGCMYITGVVLTTGAQNLIMLILGRSVLGCGVGFGTQAAPIYLSEMAPARLRGALNITFQLLITVGILIANLVNYGTQKLDSWGWRLSFGIGGVPALILTFGCLFLVETPNSLIERGLLEQGKFVLKKVRGTDDVDAEFEDLLLASQSAVRVENPFKNLLKRRNLPQLVIAVLLQVFQQFTGINAIMFYSPVLFQTLGFGSSASLYSAVITGTVNVFATIISILIVDKFGRRILLLEGGCQMFFAQAVIGIILGIGLRDTGSLSHVEAIIIVAMICIFVSGFAWSWGSMGWLIPSETFSHDTRSAGLSIVVSVNLLFTFVIAQALLSMLCVMKYGLFLFFSALLVIMSGLAYFFIPETKGISIDDTAHLWEQHWFWKKIVHNANDIHEVIHQTQSTSEITTHLLENDEGS